MVTNLQEANSGYRSNCQISAIRNAKGQKNSVNLTIMCVVCIQHQWKRPLGPMAIAVMLSRNRLVALMQLTPRQAGP